MSEPTVDLKIDEFADGEYTVNAREAAGNSTHDVACTDIGNPTMSARRSLSATPFSAYSSWWRSASVWPPR